MIDDAAIKALFDQEAKPFRHLFGIHFRWRHFGDNDTLAAHLNIEGGDDGNRYA